MYCHCLKIIFDYKTINYHHYSKTSCFGHDNLPLSNEKDAFFDTKTTCFAF